MSCYAKTLNIIHLFYLNHYYCNPQFYLYKEEESIKKLFILTTGILLILSILAVSLFNKQNWALEAINFHGVEEQNNTSPVKVALIDSGIQAREANVTVAESLRAENPHDFYGHGTAVASIIGAQKSFFNPVEGVFKNVIFYNANILDENGNTSIPEIIAAIEWAVKHEVDIINMSFGIQKDDPALHKAVKEAYEHNIIVVAAAGNNLGFEADYPARYQEVLSISSVDKNLNRDPIAAKSKIDYVAPGINIEAVQVNKMKDKKLNGTSFAAAYATGIIAKLLSEQKIEKKDYISQLKNYSKPLGNKKEYGNGLLLLN